jgi:hypothetical protein
VIYREIALPHSERVIAMSRLELDEATALFRRWQEKTDKVVY